MSRRLWRSHEGRCLSQTRTLYEHDVRTHHDKNYLTKCVRPQHSGLRHFAAIAAADKLAHQGRLVDRFCAWRSIPFHHGCFVSPRECWPQCPSLCSSEATYSCRTHGWEQCPTNV